MDYEMPIMNGIEVILRLTWKLQASVKIKRMKEEGRINKNLVIIAYTAYMDEEENCRKSGMDYFCKFKFSDNVVPKPATLA